MATDDERRRVAERLRGDPGDTPIPYRTGVHFGMGCHEAANRFWDICERIKSAGDYDIAYSTRSVLADLIEPSCDRDALLALADDMDRAGTECRCTLDVKCWDCECDEVRPENDDPNVCWRACMRDCARRIREACGEVG